MTGLIKNCRVLALVSFALVAGSCRDKLASVGGAASPMVVGSEREELGKFYRETRSLYNNRQYAELETLANRIRSGKERLASGSWKTVHFYTALECRDDEPESMWQLHDEIHREWETRYPDSITARVAYAEFLLSYGWHARGGGYAGEVTEDGWQLFHERLAEAHTVLDQSRSLVPACPMWGISRLNVALGQGESPADYEALFQEAKKSEPHFFGYDLARARYLLPRWHGEPGDWEAAADKEIDRPGGLGAEGYARVVSVQAGYYDNVFKESKASWRKTKKGFEEMRARYPDSKGLLNNYCRMACFAGDREQAKKLFAEIGEDKIQGEWRTKGNEFERAKAWAMEK